MSEKQSDNVNLPEITLPETGLKVKVRSLTWEQAGMQLDLEDKAGKDARKQREMVVQVIEWACPGMFERIKDSSHDVVTLHSAIIRLTLGLEAERKN
ncbi:MAG: hypothetical protein ACOZHQ_09465 [Thermodesulfobacteriota bacterium]